MELATDKLLNRIKSFRDKNLKPEVAVKVNDMMDILSTKEGGAIRTSDIFDTRRSTKLENEVELVCLMIKGQFISFIDWKAAEEYDEIEDDDKAKDYINKNKDQIQQAAATRRSTSMFDSWSINDSIWDDLKGVKKGKKRQAESPIHQNRLRSGMRLVSFSLKIRTPFKRK